MKEYRQFQCPAVLRSRKQNTFSCTGNKVGPRRKIEAFVVEDDPHICWSVDLKTVILLTKVPENIFCFFFFFAYS